MAQPCFNTGACIGLSVVDGGLRAEPILAPYPDNILVCTELGMYVPQTVLPTYANTNCVTLAEDVDGVVHATAVVNPAADNMLSCTALGLYAPHLPWTGTSLPPLPHNGQECMFYVGGADGWHLKYLTSGGGWIPVGVNAVRVDIGDVTMNPLAGTTFLDGASFYTFPLAGIYDVHLVASKIQGPATNDPENAQIDIALNAGGTRSISTGVRNQRYALTVFKAPDVERPLDQPGDANPGHYRINGTALAMPPWQCTVTAGQSLTWSVRGFDDWPATIDAYGLQAWIRPRLLS